MAFRSASKRCCGFGHETRIALPTRAGGSSAGQRGPRSRRSRRSRFDLECEYCALRCFKDLERLRHAVNKVKHIRNIKPVKESWCSQSTFVAVSMRSAFNAHLQ